jgi:DNA-binding transcriptional ArsR family regulator
MGVERGRPADERILLMLRLRHEGMPAAVIAQRLGMQRGAVVRDLRKVFAADLAESGEPEGVVRGAYW